MSSCRREESSVVVSNCHKDERYFGARAKEAVLIIRLLLLLSLRELIISRWHALHPPRPFPSFLMYFTRHVRDVNKPVATPSSPAAAISDFN